MIGAAKQRKRNHKAKRLGGPAPSLRRHSHDGCGCSLKAQRQNDRAGAPISDLFSSASPQETASRSPNPTANAVPRHVLPSDLPAAIKHLNDHDLDCLLAAVVAERLRRGMKSLVPDKTPSKRVEAATVSLTPGKLNAVRAAFKAGVTLSKIAKEFGISQSNVRRVIANEGMKKRDF